MTSQSSEITAFVVTFNGMLERLADERRQSARTALGAQEAERLRTAQELHDEIGQSLTAVALRSNSRLRWPTRQRQPVLARWRSSSRQASVTSAGLLSQAAARGAQ